MNSLLSTMSMAIRPHNVTKKFCYSANFSERISSPKRTLLWGFENHARFSKACRKVSCTKVTLPTSERDMVSLDAQWSDFALVSSGEWDGYSADFDTSGNPIKLPDNVVPPAYAEWGLDVYDWQTQSPTNVGINEDSLSYYSRTVRLLPTVGCEADAATLYSVEEKFGGWETPKVQSAGVNLGGASFSGSFCFHSSGSYIAVWPGKIVPSNTSRFGNATAFGRKSDADAAKLFWEIEHCLQDTKEGGRVRFFLKFERENKPGTAPELKGVGICREKWEGEFKNGASLGGCGQKETAFAESKKFQIQALEGEWGSIKYSAQSLTNPALLSEEPSKFCLESDMKGNVVLLPKDMWCQISTSEMEPSGYKVSVGWMPSSDKVLISQYEACAENQVSTLIVMHRK